MPKPQIFWVGAYAPPPSVEVFCAECIRDAIYADTKLIAHLEANPDIDEAFKGPIVLAARADVHRLRKNTSAGRTDQRGAMLLLQETALRSLSPTPLLCIVSGLRRTRPGSLKRRHRRNTCGLDAMLGAA